MQISISKYKIIHTNINIILVVESRLIMIYKKDCIGNKDINLVCSKINHNLDRFKRMLGRYIEDVVEQESNYNYLNTFMIRPYQPLEYKNRNIIALISCYWAFNWHLIGTCGNKMQATYAFDLIQNIFHMIDKMEGNMDGFVSP